jgi:hypothetical protein
MAGTTAKQIAILARSARRIESRPDGARGRKSDGRRGH